MAKKKKKKGPYRMNIADGQFHHVAVVKSGLDTKVYIDGKEVRNAVQTI